MSPLLRRGGFWSSSVKGGRGVRKRILNSLLKKKNYKRHPIQEQRRVTGSFTTIIGQVRLGGWPGGAHNITEAGQARLKRLLFKSTSRLCSDVSPAKFNLWNSLMGGQVHFLQAATCGFASQCVQPRPNARAIQWKADPRMLRFWWSRSMRQEGLNPSTISCSSASNPTLDALPALRVYEVHAHGNLWLWMRERTILRSISSLAQNSSLLWLLIISRVRPSFRTPPIWGMAWGGKSHPLTGFFFYLRVRRGWGPRGICAFKKRRKT